MKIKPKHRKEITIYDGDTILTYIENKEKKQMLWDAFIKWCKEHNTHSGESIQNDDFTLDAPEFMAEVIDDIIEFKAL